MILKKVIKLCEINDLVCEFGEITLIALVCGLSRVPFFFFLIELNYVIMYFSFYNIVKKLVLKKICYEIFESP